MTMTVSRSPDTPAPPAREGSLVVVGTGLMTLSHITPAARYAIEHADLVLFGVMDAWTVHFLRRLNENCESLPYPGDDSLRRDTYDEMVRRMLAPVREGKRVCAVFYGHPAVFVDAAPRAVRQARAEGYLAELLPAISALDCLFADIDFDPGRRGCTIVEATDLLVRVRPFDASTPLIVLQVGAIGNSSFVKESDAPRTRYGLELLTELLGEQYSLGHIVTLYEASMLATEAPRIQRLALGGLPHATVTALTTLFVPHEREALRRDHWETRLHAFDGIPVSTRV